MVDGEFDELRKNKGKNNVNNIYNFLRTKEVDGQKLSPEQKDFIQSELIADEMAFKKIIEDGGPTTFGSSYPLQTIGEAYQILGDHESAYEIFRYDEKILRELAKNKMDTGSRNTLLEYANNRKKSAEQEAKYLEGGKSHNEKWWEAHRARVLEKQDAKIVWVKEGEILLEDDKNLFLLNDVLFYPITSRVEKRTGIIEGVISYIDREEKINKVYTSQDNKRGEWGYEFFLNADKFNKFLDEVKEVYKKSKEFRDKLDKLNLEKISLSDLKEIFAKDIETLWQSKVLGYFTIDPYSWKIEKTLKDRLSKILLKEEFENVFGTLLLQEERDSLENERYSWLKKIILPALQKGIKPQEIKKDKSLLNKIEEHFNNYKSYSAGFGMKMWDMDYYLQCCINPKRIYIS